MRHFGSYAPATVTEQLQCKANLLYWSSTPANHAGATVGPGSFPPAVELELHAPDPPVGSLASRILVSLVDGWLWYSAEGFTNIWMVIPTSRTAP